jgi:protein-disulfide isomerase
MIYTRTTRKQLNKTREFYMAPTDKNRPSGSVSTKKSAKERREAQRRAQQRQQQVILAVLAAVLLVGVVLVLFVSLRPVEAIIPDNAVSRYQDFQDKKLYGTTAEGYPYLGAETAPVKLEEFSSFSCPHCKDYHDANLVNLLDMAKNGLVKIVVIPVTNFGSFTPVKATQGAMCAGQQGKFFEFQDVLFDWQGRYGEGMSDTRRLNAAAKSLNLDTDKFNACLNDSTVEAKIREFEQQASTRGVSATPTIFIDGVQIDPPVGTSSSPSFSELRGIIESRAAAAGKQ